jgi:DNA polymerase-1
LAGRRRLICDIETNGLNPSRIWVIVCKDIDTGEVHVFREPDRSDDFAVFTRSVDLWVGHNFLGFDLGVLQKLLPGAQVHASQVVDTLIVSRVVHYARSGGHSLRQFGTEFGRLKPEIEEEGWEEFSEALVHRCREDVEINFLLYQRLRPYIESKKWADALWVEHEMVCIGNDMTKNGFHFSLKKAKELKEEINHSLSPLEEELKSIFPKKVKKGNEVLLKYTKFGTLSKVGLQWYLKSISNDLSIFKGDFSRISYEDFNPASPKHRIERLWEAGWQPLNKTKTHRELEKEIAGLRRARKPIPEEDLARLEKFKVYGWTVDEENLDTLPDTAPDGIRKLVRWLKLKNRTSTLESWINACVPSPDGLTGRIHGSFNHIGAWTGRMSHDNPNMGNVPKFNSKRPDSTPYSDQMRSLWSCTPGRYLIGVDAESIQLRIFGHYIDDGEFINALIAGDKADATDPHSVNQRALGPVCKSRDDAKTFIYAWLLGAGIAKVAAILGCSRDEASTAVDNFIVRYPGLVYLKREVIPRDAHHGYFEGLDGRYVYIKGEDEGSRAHFCLGGYLQNGEAVIMKRANVLWRARLTAARLPFWQVNFVHDEWQVETVRDWDTALEVAKIIADSIREVGEDLKLRCPMAGSILSDHGTMYNGSRLAIGDNWMETH